MKRVNALLGMGLLLAGMGSDAAIQPERKKSANIGGFRHKIATRSQKDRANTIKRMKVNERRKKFRLPVLRSQSRFGGYRIPSI